MNNKPSPPPEDPVDDDTIEKYLRGDQRNGAIVLTKKTDESGKTPEDDGVAVLTRLTLKKQAVKSSKKEEEVLSAKKVKKTSQLSSEEMEELGNLIGCEDRRKDIKNVVVSKTSGEEFTELQREHIEGLKEEVREMNGDIEKCRFLQSSLLAKVIMPIKNYAEKSGLKVEKRPKNIDSTKNHAFLVLKMGGSGQLLFFGGQHAHKISEKEIESIYQSIKEVIEFFQKKK